MRILFLASILFFFYISVSSSDSDQNIASITVLVDSGDNEPRFCSSVSDFSTSFVICEMHSETLDTSDQPVTYGGTLFYEYHKSAVHTERFNLILNCIALTSRHFTSHC